MTVVGVALLAATAMWMTRFQGRPSGYRLKLAYSDVNGLTTGASVMLMGVRIGRVLSVKPTDRSVELECLIEDAETRIFRGSEFKIYSKGLIGDKALEIFPPEVPTIELIPKDTLIRGDDPVRMDRTFEAADGAVKAIRKYADSPEAQKTFQEGMAAVRETFAKVDALTEHLNALVLEANGFVTHGRMLAGTIRERDVRAMVDDLRFLTKGMRQSYQSLLGSPEQKSAAQEAMDNLATLSARLANVATQIEQFTSDPKLKADLTDIVKQSRGILTALQPPEGRKTPAFSPRLALQGISQTDAANTPPGLNTLSANLGLSLAFGDTAFVAGAEELGNNSLFTFTWGMPRFFADNIGFHLGLVRSKMGMGVDYMPLPGTEIRAELFDPVRTQVRLSASYFPDFLASRYGLDIEWIQSLNRSAPNLTSARVGIQWRPLD